MRNFELVQELKLELIREYERYVRILAGLTGSSVGDAREALHRSICRMLASLKKRPAGDLGIAWRPYVIQAAVYQLRKEIHERKRVILFSELDKEGRRELLGVSDPHPTPLEHLEKKETAEILWKEVNTLAPREAEVLKRWAHGSGFQQIAAALGMEPSTARELWSRGIRHLRARPRIQKLAA